MSETGVKLTEIIEHFNMETLYASSDIDEIVVTTQNINRPGLPFIGFFDYFDENRVQLIGYQEYAYLNGLTEEARRHCLEELFKRRIPAFVLARSFEPFDCLDEIARKYDKTVLRTKELTSIFISAFVSYMSDMLSPRITRHGVLVEVYGEGCLIMGESGVGKSETAVELLKRGHRLIADDAVEIRRLGGRLVGNSPDLIRHYMELRGIGVIDVMRLFGMSAVRDEKYIDLIINLEQWDSKKAYDRLGLDSNYTEILNVKLPSLVVPVKPGRNLAVIVEVAAMNNRDKRMGFNAAQELTERIENQAKIEKMNHLYDPSTGGGYMN